MSAAGEDHESRNELFDSVEKRGNRRLDGIVPDGGDLDSPRQDARQTLRPEEIPVPPGLAERTCRRLWNALDRAEVDSTSGLDVFSADMARTATQSSSLIPKCPRYERASKKSAPFIIKKMSITEEPAPDPRVADRLNPPLAASADLMLRADLPTSAIPEPTLPNFTDAAFVAPAVIQPAVIPPAENLPAVIQPAVIPPAEIPTVEAPLASQPEIAPVAAIKPAAPVVAPIAAVKPAAPVINAKPAAPVAAVKQAAPVAAAKPTAASTTRQSVTPLSIESLKRQFAKESIKPRPKRKNRCPLVNGQIRPSAQDEYYWEILPPETPAEKELHRKRKLAAARRTQEEPEEENRLVESVSEIGRTTLSCIDSAKSWFGVPATRAILPDEMNRPLRGKRRGRPSDMLISIIAGILIATTVVFPTLRFACREFGIVITKTTVRKIGQKIPVSSGHQSADLLPFYTEQLLFPKSQEVEFQPKDSDLAEGVPFIPTNPERDATEQYLTVSGDAQPISPPAQPISDNMSPIFGDSAPLIESTEPLFPTSSQGGNQ